MTSRCLAEMKPGERLLVIGDDPEMLSDLAEWCTESGNRIVDRRELDGEFRCVLERGG